MDETHVVTVFLESDGQIVILRRSDRVGTYRGRWGGVAGYLESGVTPREQALTEIREETGLEANEVRLVVEGEVVRVVDQALGRVWLVHPFRFQAVAPDKVMVDWEHTEFRWINPAALGSYDTVPGLAEAWASVTSGDGPGG